MDAARGHWKECDQRLHRAVVEGERILARGRANEIIGSFTSLDGGRHVYVVVTDRRVLWTETQKAALAKLSFDDITSYSEAFQYHRYAIVLRHTPTRRVLHGARWRLLWFRWGNKEQTRWRQESVLAFSHHGTAVAGALRERLEARGIARSRPVSLDERPRRERVAGAQAVVVAPAKRRPP